MMLNDIEKYLSNEDNIFSETSSTRGQCTLLWEKESGSEDEEIGELKTTIQVESLQEYKYLYFITYTYYTEFNQWMPDNGIGGSVIIPTQIIKENSTLLHGASMYFYAKYIDESHIEITYNNFKDEYYPIKYKIYGIE